MVLALSVLLQAFFMAYGMPNHNSQFNRLDFSSTSICSQDLVKNTPALNHSPQSHKQQSREQKSEHDHCLQGCFLCAFCLTYRDAKGNCTHNSLDGHLITWLPITEIIVVIDYASNQARAPPVVINKLT